MFCAMENLINFSQFLGAFIIICGFSLSFNLLLLNFFEIFRSFAKKWFDLTRRKEQMQTIGLFTRLSANLVFLTLHAQMFTFLAFATSGVDFTKHFLPIKEWLAHKKFAVQFHQH
jgi:hypothetical protein